MGRKLAESMKNRNLIFYILVIAIGRKSKWNSSQSDREKNTIEFKFVKQSNKPVDA